MPKGGLGEIKKYVSTKLGLYNQYEAGKPQRYGAYSKTYDELRYNSNHKIELITNGHIQWNVAANKIPGDWSVRDICIPTQYYLWTTNFNGMTQYVNIYTGADAGATSHSSAESFQFNGNTYHWELSSATGMVGNLKFQGAKSDGTHGVPNNWQIHFSDLEGKPKTYNAFFSCIKGARLLWLEDSAYATGYTGYGKKE